ALQPGQGLDGSAERQDGRHRDVTGNAQQRLKLRLLGNSQGRDRAREALVTCGKQDVPDEEIDRRAADEPDPLKVLIRRGDHLEVHADDENDGRLEHRLGEPAGCGRLLDRRRVHRRRVDRVPRAVAGRDLGRVPLGGWRGQRRERLSGGALTHDDHPPALAIVVVAALPAAAVVQVRGGTIRVGMDADTTTMDPHRSTAAVDRQVYNNVYSKLVDIDARFGIVPQLAQTWEIKGGGLVYVFKLRRGVKFHDGTEFNADIVKWNFDRMRDPELASPRRSEIAPVKDVKVLDPFTVEITLSSPFAPLLSVLTDRAGMMVSRAAVEKYTDDFARNPVGTGPFRFVEWVKDDHLTLKRLDGYWEAGLPHLDEVVYRPIPDSSVRFTAMRTGQMDIMHQIHPKDVATAKTERGMKVSEIASLWWQGIHLNNQVAPFTNKTIRQAVWYAVDRSVIQRVAYFGSGAPGWGPFPPSMWAQDRDF